jgi:hypothetical protein
MRHVGLVCDVCEQSQREKASPVATVLLSKYVPAKMHLRANLQIPYCHGTNRRAGLSKSLGQTCRPSSVCAAADSSKQPPPVYIEDSATLTFLNWATSAGIQFPKLKVGTAHHQCAHTVLSSCLGQQQQQASLAGALEQPAAAETLDN